MAMHEILIMKVFKCEFINFDDISDGSISLEDWQLYELDNYIGSFRIKTSEVK